MFQAKFFEEKHSTKSIFDFSSVTSHMFNESIILLFRTMLGPTDGQTFKASSRMVQQVPVYVGEMYMYGTMIKDSSLMKVSPAVNCRCKLNYLLQT